MTTQGSWARQDANVALAQCSSIVQVNGSQETPARPSSNGLSTASWQAGNGKASPAHTAPQSGSSTNGSHREASTAAATGNSTDAQQQASAADIVEGWVGNNLNSFVSDPATVTPGITSPNVLSRRGGAASASSSADLSGPQQHPQQDSGNGRRASRLNGQQNGAGQQGQGYGQGRFGPSGGSWATVDDEMEKARQFLSPWR